MTALVIIGSLIAAILVMCLISRHIARIVGSALLAHADALDAYRDRMSTRTEHWFNLSTEHHQPVRMERRISNG